jgi:energy-coupling factor transport system permease protein
MALLGDITIGKYVEADSPLHRLDPRTKFLAALALMVGLVRTSGLPALGLCAAFLGLAIALSGLPAGLVLRNLRAFLWLFFFTFALHALLTPGQALWHLPYFGHAISAAGLERGVLLSARLASVICTASLLTLTTAPLDLTRGLERLLAPFKRLGLPADEIALTASIALRFIPVLIEEAERLHRAQLARGADPGGRLLQRARNLVPLLVPLFVSAFAHADRLALAMESRGYRSGAKRTTYRPLHLQSGDVWAGLAVAALLGLLPLVDWWGD